ncbi:MAG TPA: alpha/beta fold hydrolase [Solirubrobacteraceae bacterium]|jgi:pimeloyl-ACP methyl ester carboxylesterase|nr:alpha/beta fold hydrolase [Solirubrobacteraceae bacterium]
MRRRRVPRWIAVAATVAVSAGALAAGATASAHKGASTSPNVGPSGLKFYAPAQLPAGVHGTLIWERPFHGVAALKGATNYLVLYKQVGVTGKQVAVSGIVSIPKGKAPKSGFPVVTFAHGTTGIADQCAPSRDTGRSSGANEADTGVAPLLNTWIKDGDAVVRTDYEGLGTPGTHPYLIGTSEGHGVLDIVRAARQLDGAISNRVVIAGHSQGGQAALWAASLAPKYTPDLDVLGTVAFAPQSHTADEVSLLKSLDTASLTPLASLILRGIDVAYPSLHVNSLLTPAGAKLYPQTLTACLGQLESTSSFGGLPLDQLVQPSANLTPVVSALAANDPDGLKIKAPVLLEQGLADTTVLPQFDQELSQELAKLGDKVTYHTYPGATHGSVLIAAAKDATAFVKKRFGR